MKESTFELILNLIRNHLAEEVPTNNLGSGRIAGTSESGQMPPIFKRTPRRLIRRKSSVFSKRQS
jgi:hypothetical protein